ncbi:FIST signal transduction protein [Neptuniibacter sp. QD72_48]|uniref:FIST signal transduction protein n=1 Tax=unclassified Neptuniibacter TaxID=2630693 RepID=UPI0039F45A3A
MYVRFNNIQELVGVISGEPLNTDEHWLILLADKHQNDLDNLVQPLNNADCRFFGAVFPGLIHGKRMLYEGALVIKVSCLSPPVAIPMPSKDAQIETLPTYSDIPESGATCLTLVDCLSPQIDNLLNQLYNRFSKRCSYFGAGAGNHELRPDTCIFGPWGTLNDTALIAIINQPSNSVAKHGWIRHSGPYVASRTTGNILHELDWEDAESAYRHALPEKLRNTPPERFYKDVTPRYPFAVEHPGSEDVVRDPIALCGNTDVMFLSDIPQGALMYLVEGSPDNLIEAARQAAEEVITDLTSSVLVCDCLSRTVALDSQFPAELRTVYEQVNQINPGTDVSGILALGEIASNGDRPVNFYNKTFGICSFYE